MIIAANILILGLLAWWGSGYTRPFSQPWYWIALGLKISGGLLMGLVYIIYLGSGDTIMYYEEAIKIASTAQKSIPEYIQRLFTSAFPAYKGEYRTDFFARILSFFMILTGNNYWLASIYLSLISFFGTWGLVRTISNTYHQIKWMALMGFLVIPSVIFWSSGILKDSLANAGFFYLCTFLIRFYHRKSISLAEHLGYAFTLIILIKLRFYLGAAMMLAIGFIVAWHILKAFIRNSAIRYVLISVLTLLLIVSVSYVDYNLQFNHLPQSIYQNYTSIIDASAPGHTLSFDLSPEWGSVILNAPKSFLYGLFGPLPGQGSFTSALYWIENCLLIVLFLWSVFFIIKKRSFPVCLTPVNMIAFVFIVSMAIAIPLVAPNFGTMMRYKASFLPFLWMFLLFFPFRFGGLRKSV